MLEAVWTSRARFPGNMLVPDVDLTFKPRISRSGTAWEDSAQQMREARGSD
jgi:hypothetical protein